MNNAWSGLMMAGYAGLPFGEVSQCKSGDAAVLGVPSESDAGPRSGTSLAPDALRRMTQQLGTNLPVNGRDLGNLDLSGDWSGTLTQLVAEMARESIIPVILGGEANVGTVVLQALPELPVVAAMPQARRDLVERPENTLWMGLNGEQPAELWDEIDKRKMPWRTARQLDEGHAETIDLPERAVLWLDVSVIDLGHAAGSVGLNPGGMKPETLVTVPGSMTCDWQAIVVTGLAPACDTRGMSELAVIETLNAVLRHG